MMIPQQLNSTSVEISWDEVVCTHQNGDITGYEINYSISRTENWITQSTNQTVFTANGLLPLTSYVFRVAAINNEGIGPFSNDVTFKTEVPDSKSSCSYSI